MINDIVQLPARLKQFKRSANIKAETMMWYPISTITRSVGYPEPDDTSVVQYGTNFELPTGMDTFFRYKFVETTKSGICEYVVFTEEPIDIARPYNSLCVTLYPLWVNFTDRNTCQTKKFVLWNNVAKFSKQCGVKCGKTAPLEAVIADEIRAFAAFYGYQDELLRYVCNMPSVNDETHITEETKESDDLANKLMLLGSNILAYHDCFDTDLWQVTGRPDIVLSGIELPEKHNINIHLIQMSDAFWWLSKGPVKLGDIKPVFSPTYGRHMFRRPFKLDPLNPYTEISIEDENLGIFELIKYFEHLPYSEFEVKFDREQKTKITLFNPYDLNAVISNAHVDHLDTLEESLRPIKTKIGEVFPDYVRMTVVRSWSEEIYITLVDKNDNIERFYYDMAAATIGSRALMRDYSGCMFTLGF